MISEADKAVCDEFIDYIRMLTNMLGFNVFEKAVTREADAGSLRCSSTNGTDASGYYSLHGFMVKKGSHISRDVTESMKVLSAGYYALRLQLINNDTIHNGIFTVDYEFNSPSAAASVVLGRSVNGRTEWKEGGGTLPPPPPPPPTPPITERIGPLYLTHRGSNAVGYMEEDGRFTVQKGSRITPFEPTATCPPGAKKALLLNQSKMNGTELIEDIQFIVLPVHRISFYRKAVTDMPNGMTRTAKRLRN